MSDNLKVKDLIVYGCVEKDGMVEQVEDAKSNFFSLYAVMVDIHNGEFMENKMTGKEIASTVEKMISTRAAIKIANELFRSRCDIKPAIEKLQKDIDYLNSEIEQNKAAINFLNRFVEN